MRRLPRCGRTGGGNRQGGGWLGELGEHLEATDPVRERRFAMVPLLHRQLNSLILLEPIRREALHGTPCRLVSSQ